MNPVFDVSSFSLLPAFTNRDGSLVLVDDARYDLVQANEIS